MNTMQIARAAAGALLIVAVLAVHGSGRYASPVPHNTSSTGEGLLSRHRRGVV
jgi:hypothetical protein